MAFALAMLALAASPGPGVFAAAAQALAGGFRSAAGVVAAVLSGVLGVYAYGAARTRRLFSGFRARRRFNRTAGTVLIGTGVVIASR